MVGIERVLRRLQSDLEQLGAQWALVGGLAVSARAEPRTTRDLDVAIAVRDDREAQHLSMDLRARGYLVDTVLEQETTDRLATVRLVSPGEDASGIVVDLLFASSGVETEVVEAADSLEIVPGLFVPVARLAHLLALKVLAGRPKDFLDFESLTQEATAEDLRQCQTLLGLIQERGFNRGKDLSAILAQLIGS